MNIKLPDEIYDILKYVVTICLPALMTFLGVVLPALGVSAEATTTVVTILGALATLIGTLIGISSIQYRKDNEDEDN